MQKIKSALTSPLFWIALAIGAVLAVAVPAVARVVKPVADNIPGSKSKTSA